MDQYREPRMGIALNEGNMVAGSYLDACLQQSDVLEVLLDPDCSLPQSLAAPTQQSDLPLRLHLSPHIKELSQFEQSYRELRNTIRHLGEERVDALITHPFSPNTPVEEFGRYIQELAQEGYRIEVENGAPAARKDALPSHRYEAFPDIGELCHYLATHPDSEQCGVVFDLGKWAEHYLATHPSAQELPLAETISRYQPWIRSFHLCEKERPDSVESEQSISLRTVPMHEDGLLRTTEVLSHLVPAGIPNYIIETNEKPAGLYVGLIEGRELFDPAYTAVLE